MEIIMFNSGLSQPEDEGILLKDIIEGGYVDRQKDYCIDANYAKGGNPQQYFNKSRRQLAFDNKEACDNLRPCELRESSGKSSLCHHVATATDIKGNQAIFSEVISRIRTILEFIKVRDAVIIEVGRSCRSI